MELPTAIPPTQPPPAAAAAADNNLPLSEGDTCSVLWRDNTTILKAKVIERRLCSGNKAASSAADTTKEPECKKIKVGDSVGDYEYYVHYVEHDR